MVRISSVCWPNSGAGSRTDPGVSRRRTGMPTTGPGPNCGWSKLGDVVVGLHLRVVGQLVDAVDDGEDEVTTGAQNLHPLGARLGGEDGVEDLDGGARVGGAITNVDEALVGGQLRPPEDTDEVGPVAIRLQHAEADPLVVAALVVVPQRIVGELARHARDGEAHHAARRDAQALQPDHAAEVRRVDFLADAEAVARQQRREHAVGQHDPAHLIGDAAGDLQGRIAGLTGGQHHAGARQTHLVERRILTLRTFRPVAGGAGVDQLRIVLAQRFVPEPKP